MYRKIIVVTAILLLAVTSIGNTGLPVASGGSDFAIEDRPFSAQEEESQYNVSSYHDFALAAADILASRLVDDEFGAVYHFGFSDWNTVAWQAYGGQIPIQNLADYYWAIAGMARAYNMTTNSTLSVLITKAANQMVQLFRDPDYPGFFVYRPLGSLPVGPEVLTITESKRAGIQAYAYYALSMAEAVNDTLDFSVEKDSALKALTDMLYDDVYGGFHFMAYRNGTVSSDATDVYPNDGKRLDHLALGTLALYDAGSERNNDTMVAMANSSLAFMIDHMVHYNNSILEGFSLVTNRSGSEPIVGALERPPRTIVTDLNAMAIRSLLRGYEVTGNSTYLYWAEGAHDALLNHNWDSENAGWYVETLDREPYAPTGFEDTERYKYSEIQFQMVLAEEMLYENTENTFFIQLVIDTLDMVLARLWDKNYGGFYANGDDEALVFDDVWRDHYTGVQGLAVLALERVWGYGLPIVSNVRVTPTNPRPTDKISFLATVLDSDGVDCVIANCSISRGGQTNISLIELSSNPLFGGVYNTTIGPLQNETRVNFVVFANDSLGNAFVAGSYFFVVREDVWSPVVLLRTVYPSDEVRVGDNVIIEFGTYEFPTHSKIVSFKVYWKVNDGFYEPKNMTLVDFDGDYLVWIADMGDDFRENDVLSYYCLAIDESDNVGESAFYRLTILGPRIFVTPWSPWQVAAALGLVAAPGVGYGLTRIRRREALSTQRALKKEARHRARRKRSRRARSKRDS